MQPFASCDADTGGYQGSRRNPLLREEDKRLVEHVQEALGNERWPYTRESALGQDDELITAEAPDRVGWPQRMPQTISNRFEELISGNASEAVVDVLEMVQVHDEGRHRNLLPSRPRQHLLGPVQDQSSIR